MKILLIGEYSRLHNSLKEGLEALNHEVKIIGTGDSFKQFPIDYSIFPKYFLSNKFCVFLNKILFRIFKIDLQLLEKGIRFWLYVPKLKDYDIVQLINSNAIETYPFLSKYLLKKIFKQNKNHFLLVCGEDTPIIDFLMRDTLKYSIMTPYLKNPKLKSNYRFSLKYMKDSYRNLFDFVRLNVSGIIVSDLDYKIPLPEKKLIPNPINITKLSFEPLIIDKKIIIFIGINKGSYIKKGSFFFEESLEIIKEKHKSKIEIITAESLPYNEYITLYNKAHIILDQIYGYDQGYNALEAMAKGKVVFTGAEKEFMEYYNLKERVAINALPDVDYLVNELSFLIQNPEEIIDMGKRARVFIEKEHNYIKIAKKYMEVWNEN